MLPVEECHRCVTAPPAFDGDSGKRQPTGGVRFEGAGADTCHVGETKTKETRAMNGANGHEMRDAVALKLLNRLLILFQYSLASYLRYADPWTQPGKSR